VVERVPAPALEVEQSPSALDLVREELQESAALVPARAVGLWLSLQEALDERGPTPCQSSPVPQAWDYDGPVSRDLASLAIEGCLACPVRASCLSYALAADERHGVWGGTTRPQRRALLARDMAS
jgi:hypothetical protein